MPLVGMSVSKLTTIVCKGRMLFLAYVQHVIDMSTRKICCILFGSQ